MDPTVLARALAQPVARRAPLLLKRGMHIVILTARVSFESVSPCVKTPLLQQQLRSQEFLLFEL